MNSKIPQKMRITFILLSGLAAGLTSLSACVPLVIGGAMVGGGMVASDRRTSGAQLEDEGIELRAGNAVRSATGDRAHINITSFNRQVLLTGEVPSDREKRQVEQIATDIENVRLVVNELGVMPITAITQRSNDTFITGKVKASLLDARDLFANSFKVLTERNVVYIMGRVTPREGKRAAEIARGISGVDKVVRVVELISEEDLQRGINVPGQNFTSVATDGQPAGLPPIQPSAPRPQTARSESSGVVITPIPSR